MKGNLGIGIHGGVDNGGVGLGDGSYQVGFVESGPIYILECQPKNKGFR